MISIKRAMDAPVVRRANELETIGDYLKSTYGPPPTHFYLPGWLCENLCEAKLAGWSSDFVAEILEGAYMRLLARLTNDSEVSQWPQ